MPTPAAHHTARIVAAALADGRPVVVTGSHGHRYSALTRIGRMLDRPYLRVGLDADADYVRAALHAARLGYPLVIDAAVAFASDVWPLIADAVDSDGVLVVLSVSDGEASEMAAAWLAGWLDEHGAVTVRADRFVWLDG